MASRFWTFVNNLLAGQTARSEQVAAQFQEVDTALGGVEAELNRSIRFTSDTPTESTFQIGQSAAQRANTVVAFDASGNIGVSPAAFAWRGAWAGGTSYIVNDVVQAPEANSYSLYVVRAAHTSGTFNTDVSAGRLVLMIDLTEVRRSLVLHTLITGPNSVALTAGQDVMVDVASGAVSLTLPASPAIGDQPINIMHVGGDIASNPITVLRNGNRIMGLTEDMTVNTPNASFGLAYCNATRGWRIRGV